MAGIHDRLLTTLLALFALSGLWGCQAIKERLFNPKIEVKCQILEGRCTFNNYGDPGEACVVVRVHNVKSGALIKSKPVCSGHIERDDPKTVAVEFDKGDPLQLCMGEDLADDFKENCDVEIKEHHAEK